MNLNGKEFSFRKRNSSNPYRVLALLFVLLGSLFMLRAIETEQIVSPFHPTPVPTRNISSLKMQAEAHFMAGDLDQAIAVYQRALEVDPNNALLWAELSRIQTYSSALLTSDTEKRARLQEALQSADKAVELAPEESTVHAIRAFALNWSANPALSGKEAAAYITEADQEAVRALQLDNQNTLALAYYAEILNDQQKWLQAEQYIRQAVEKDPTLMDVHRISAYVQESLGNYGGAIEEYKKAIAITPNLTMLYISIGLNYRVLKQFEMALEYFAKAANINEQLGIRDPIPYIAIGKTYSQMGEFFIASRNMEKALQFNPYSPDVYGQLGIVYFKAKNYEGSILPLKCATKGCTADETCSIRNCDPAVDPAIEIEGMPLSPNTVVYYYTYGSVLAALHRPYDDKCSEAVQILGEVRDGFGGDALVMSIVQESENICAAFGITRK
ncbi:MAG: tetratricopeptide repeat protein [Anaerolineae bacterium]|nr:tetratricopeptide repeat protein [Anaerolineae bacterium]